MLRPGVLVWAGKSASRTWSGSGVSLEVLVGAHEAADEVLVRLTVVHKLIHPVLEFAIDGAAAEVPLALAKRHAGFIPCPRTPWRTPAAVLESRHRSRSCPCSRNSACPAGRRRG